MREEIVDLERADVAAPVIADHEPELGPEVRAERLGEPERAARLHRAVDLPVAHDARLGEVATQGLDDALEIPHRPAISTIR